MQGWLKQLQLPPGLNQDAPAPAYAALSALCAYLKRMRADQELATGTASIRSPLAVVHHFQACIRSLCRTQVLHHTVAVYCQSMRRWAQEITLCALRLGFAGNCEAVNAECSALDQNAAAAAHLVVPHDLYAATLRLNGSTLANLELHAVHDQTACDVWFVMFFKAQLRMKLTCLTCCCRSASGGAL